jgi:hypothetical protein
MKFSNRILKVYEDYTGKDVVFSGYLRTKCFGLDPGEMKYQGHVENYTKIIIPITYWTLSSA